MADSKNSRELPSLSNTDHFVHEGPGKRFTEPRLLYLLRKGPAHGYQLIQCMDDMPLPGPPPDTGAIYRALREMEQRGLVASRWEKGQTGPRRRIYSLTPRGEKRLSQWAEAMQRRIVLLQDFARLCEEEGG